MFTKEVAWKIDDLIKKKFPIIYDYNFDGIVLTWGGSIRNTMMGTPVNDLDLVILTQGKCQILDFIKKFNLNFFMNAGGGYKIIYNNFTIDIRTTDDLMNAAVYDADMLFYDIHIHQFIICGAMKSIENAKMTQINFYKSPIRKDKIRYKKIAKFIKYMSGGKKVKVKHNKILWYRRMLIKNFKKNLNKILDGSYSKCLRFTKKCVLECILWVLLNLLSVINFVIIPFVFGKLLIDIFNKNNDFSFLIVFFLLNIFLLILLYVIDKLELRIGKKFKYNINSDMADCVLNFRHMEDNNSSFLSVLKDDVHVIFDNFKLISNMLFENLSLILILLVVMFLDYRLGIILLIFILISLFVKVRYIKIKRNIRSKGIYDFNNCTGTYGDMIYNNINNKKNKNKYYNDNNNFIKVIGCISFVIILYVGLMLMYKDLISSSILIVISIYILLPFRYIINLSKIINLVTELNISCYRLFNLLDGNLYINNIFGKKYNKKCDGLIEFEDVSFKYRYGNNDEINNISFKIKKKEIFGLDCKNSDVSNLILNLISRLYSVSGGVVKIDGVDIFEYDEKYIRDNIALVSKNPYLFDMSIRDNFKLIKENITDKEIKNICKKVCLDEFIESLPNKYDTIIGDNGIKLDEFQKQRLCMARAIIKDTKILLLDDCNYDDKHYYTIMENIISNIKNKYTIVIVSKNKDLLKKCDNILIM